MIRMGIIGLEKRLKYTNEWKIIKALLLILFSMTKREQKIMNEQINSPLNDKNEIKSDAISLHNINYVGKINLRVNETNIDLRNKVNDFLGYELPSNNKVSGDNKTRTLWLGPNEYLILCGDNEKYSIINDLRSS